MPLRNPVFKRSPLNIDHSCYITWGSDPDEELPPSSVCLYISQTVPDWVHAVNLPQIQGKAHQGKC